MDNIYQLNRCNCTEFIAFLLLNFLFIVINYAFTARKMKYNCKQWVSKVLC